MSKASSGYQQTARLRRSPILLPNKLQLNRRDWKKIKRWAVLSLGIIALWWWHWKLLLATVVGIGLMSVTYLFQSRSWHKKLNQWQRFLTGLNRRLTVAVVSGGLGGFSTYLAASIWADAENRWLATGLILQGLASVATLGLLIGYLRQGQRHSQAARVDKLLESLTCSDPLKCLIAIRQLTRLLKNNNLPEEYYEQASEYFQLMLSSPQLPAVQQALLDSLSELDIQQYSQSSPNPIQIPLQLSKHSYRYSTIKEQ